MQEKTKINFEPEISRKLRFAANKDLNKNGKMIDLEILIIKNE